jgi:ceramide glucosyltransferase
MLGVVLKTSLEVWGGTSLFFSLLLVVGILRLRKSCPTPPAQWPPIVILRPCEGNEPGLYENLRSSVEAPYPGPRRVFLLVPSASDPAFPTLQRVVQQAPPDVPVEVLLTRPEARHNRKVAQLAMGLSRSTEPIIITADSDVRLGAADLPTLVSMVCGAPSSPVAKQAVGIAFASPVEEAPRTRWDRVSAALVGGSAQNFMALYGLYRLIGGVPSMAGALLAISRRALAEIGDFQGVRTILGEDYELARRLCEAGYSVELSPLPARCSDGGRSLRGVIARVGRWLMVVRAQRPLLLLTYPIFMAATPPLVLASLFLRTPRLSLFACALWSSRTLLSYLLRRAQGLRPTVIQSALEVLSAELLLWAGLGKALATRQVSWRGYRFRIARGGHMIPEAQSPPVRT